MRLDEAAHLLRYDLIRSRTPRPLFETPSGYYSRRREKKYAAKFRHRRKSIGDSVDKKQNKTKKKKRYTGGFEWTVKFALTLFTRAPSNALIVAAAIK